jgi:hypothetical protein
MNNQLNIIRRLLKVGGLMAFVLLLTAMAWGQSSLKATGEIAAASQTTINGASAVSGMTVFSNNRIRTGGQGAAIINLGRLGRIEFGPNTDMTLRLSREGIGGELRSNHVVVSARAGVPISINTAKGMVTTDGRQPAALTIHVESKRARVVTHLGEATVTSGGEEDRVNVERVAAGEELSQSPSSTGWQHIGPVTGAIAAAEPTQMADQVTSPVTMTATPNASTFPTLFNAGINYSIGPESGGDSKSEAPFETSITCFNNLMMPCRKKSEFKP